MSQRNSGYARQASDQYMTPEWAVRALLGVERIIGPVWEPACGEGAIAKVIREECPRATVTATDIEAEYCDDPSMCPVGVDFLQADGVNFPWWTIITNPPYGPQGKTAVRFVRHALALTKPVRGKVIMLLPNEWDSAKTRQDVLQDFPAFVGKYPLTERIRWTNLPQSDAGPSQNHAWFVWDWLRKGRDIGWIA